MDNSTLNERFGRLEDLIRSEGDTTRKRVDGLQAGFDGLGSRFDGLDVRFDGLGAQVDGLSARFDSLGVRVDELHTQIKVVAEGHGALSDHIVDIKGGIERLEAGQTSLVLRVSVVETRVTEVEKTQKVMLAEVRGLAARR